MDIFINKTVGCYQYIYLYFLYYTINKCLVKENLFYLIRFGHIKILQLIHRQYLFFEGVLKHEVDQRVRNIFRRLHLPVRHLLPPVDHGSLDARFHLTVKVNVARRPVGPEQAGLVVQLLILYLLQET